MTQMTNTITTKTDALWLARIVAARGVKRLKASITKYGATPARVAMLERFEKEAKRTKEELTEALRGEWAAQAKQRTDLN